MEAAVDSIELIWFLEQPLPQTVTASQASTCRKAALLAIGEHIEGGRRPAWMTYTESPAEGAWHYVSIVSKHRMTGQQLQGLYLAIKRQQQEEEALGRGLQLGSQGTQEEQHEVEGCMVAALTALRRQQRELQPTEYASRLDAGGLR
jgi:hypothetical protein